MPPTLNKFNKQTLLRVLKLSIYTIIIYLATKTLLFLLSSKLVEILISKYVVILDLIRTHYYHHIEIKKYYTSNTNLHTYIITSNVSLQQFNLFILFLF